VMHVLHKKYSALENLKKIHKCVCLMLHWTNQNELELSDEKGFLRF
jgi:hypothetical protein